MIISNYYRGVSEKITGFVIDTENKTFKKYVLAPTEWSHEYKVGSHICSGPLPEFKNCGDIYYYFQTKTEMENWLEKYKKLGFVEDNQLSLDFGTVTK